MFDGQSLNNVPADASYPSVVMADRGEPWTSTAINGSSFFSRNASAPTRLDPLARQHHRSVLVQWGGVAELVAGFSGADLLTVAENYATARRAAGFDLIVGLTVPDATAYTGPMETARAEYNAGLLTSEAFDAVVDVSALPEMADASNGTYFADGTHFTAAGAAVVAAAVTPVLAALI